MKATLRTQEVRWRDLSSRIKPEGRRVNKIFFGCFATPSLTRAAPPLFFVHVRHYKGGEKAKVRGRLRQTNGATEEGGSGAENTQREKREKDPVLKTDKNSGNLSRMFLL